jgi:hypothetical protein
VVTDASPAIGLGYLAPGKSQDAWPLSERAPRARFESRLASLGSCALQGARTPALFLESICVMTAIAGTDCIEAIREFLTIEFAYFPG